MDSCEEQAGPPSTGAASPKKVTFAAPPPPLRRAGAPPSPLRLRRRMARQEADMGLTVMASAADHSLVHIPEVDSPRHSLPPLALCPRWPSNDALYASDEEIARLDMSDLPPMAPATPLTPAGDAAAAAAPPSGAAALALSLLDLLPQHRRSQKRAPPPLAQQSQRKGSHAAPQLRAESAKPREAAQRLAGESEPDTCAPPAAPPTPVAQDAGLHAQHAQRGGSHPDTPVSKFARSSPGLSLSSRLTGMLGRLLWAAGASGANTAELTAFGSGPLSSSALGSSAAVTSSRSSSLEGYYSASEGGSPEEAMFRD